MLYAGLRTVAGVFDVLLFRTTNSKIIQSGKAVNMRAKNKSDGFCSKRLIAVQIDFSK